MDYIHQQHQLIEDSKEKPEEKSVLNEKENNLLPEDTRYIFPADLWEDRIDFWLNKAPQGSDAWKKHRKNRLTASSFSSAISKGIKSAKPLDIAIDITKIKLTSQTDCKSAKMHGVKTEPEAREWYCKRYNVEVKEVGLAVPKWEPRIGASLDGEVVGTDGMIEIKCPLVMYEYLQDHMNKINSDWKPHPFYHNHIWDSHYAQIQGSLKITNKKWCDYVVYATQSNSVYVERIHFDQVYWDTILWPEIQHFLNNILDPLIKEQSSQNNI
jgi:putative phage-type endonuclease